jgi:hypothetical protein
VRSETWFGLPFRRSLPLFLLGAVFFVAGVFVWVNWPHYGPGDFALWALLLALGFVSCIGGVASWLLPGDEPAPAEPRPESRLPRPNAPRRADVYQPEAWELGHGRRPVARPDFGRPLPEVARPLPRAALPTASGAPASPGGSAQPEWSEEGAHDSAREPVATILADLDGIESELAPRRTPPAPSA